MKEYLEQRIAELKDSISHIRIPEDPFEDMPMDILKAYERIEELTSALNHLNKIENEKS